MIVRVEDRTRLVHICERLETRLTELQCVADSVRLMMLDSGAAANVEEGISRLRIGMLAIRRALAERL